MKSRFNSRFKYVLDFRFKIKFNIKSYSRFSIIVMQASKKTIRKFQIGFHMKFLIQYHMQVTISLGSMYTTTDRLFKHNVLKSKFKIGFQIHYCFTFFPQVRFNYIITDSNLDLRNNGLQMVQYQIRDSITGSSLAPRNNWFQIQIQIQYCFTFFSSWLDKYGWL